MADEKKGFTTALGNEIKQLNNLIQAVEAVTVRVEQTVLAQGKGAQAPFDETPPEPAPPNPNADKGKSDSKSRRDRVGPPPPNA